MVWCAIFQLGGRVLVAVLANEYRLLRKNVGQLLVSIQVRRCGTAILEYVASGTMINFKFWQDY